MTMKAIGNGQSAIPLLALLVLALLFGGATARAAVTASLDRDRVALGDTLRLTITATENEQVNSTDLRPLLADFEILQRSTSSNTSIVNGKRSHTVQLLIDITPRREGTLKIPSMRVGQAATNMLLVSVSPAPDSRAGGDTVLFEAEVDRDSVYVQGQLILTLRVQQAVNLESRSISELQLDNAFIKPLEQHSFQRNMDGRPWLVHELRYAIFPEQSGVLEIPQQTFTARESKPRRSFFDLNSGGRRLQRKSQALTIEVLPRPDSFPGDTWLPARELQISESWSTPPEQLQAGESATRTISIRGEGLQGAQLPPVLFPPTDGLKYYPDQPLINETESASGLLGTRQDSAALVPVRAGSWTIPEIRIPWWDTEAEQLRFAVLPAREITVSAAAETTLPRSPLPEKLPVTDGIAPAPISAAGGSERLWIALSIVSSLGWLLTLGYLAWSRWRAGRTADAAAGNLSEQRACKQLLAACRSGDAVLARQGLIDWARALFPQAAVVSMDQAAAVFGDEALRAELARLNAALYARGATSWHGETLAGTVRRLRKQHLHKGAGGEDELSLYPVGGTT